MVTLTQQYNTRCSGNVPPLHVFSLIPTTSSSLSLSSITSIQLTPYHTMLTIQDKSKETASREEAESAIFNQANLFTPEATREGKWDVASFVFTHFGQVVTWYCPPEIWFQVQNQVFGTAGTKPVLVDKTAAIDQHQLEATLVSPLINESVRFSDDLHNGLSLLSSGSDKGDYNLVKEAFTISPLVFSKATV